MPLRDGRWLAADVVRPAGGAARPAVVVQTPYGKEKLGAVLPLASARSGLEFRDPERTALVIADWRGYHGSREAGGGRPAPHRGEDGADLVAWTADQPWCDGRVAAWGPSALGRAVIRTAEARPRSLLCGIPVVCAPGHFYEDFYEGGVLKEAHLGAVDALGFDLGETVRGEPLSGTEFHLRGEREYRPEAVDVPLLLVTGWYDVVTARTLRFFADLRARGGPRARRHSRLLVGPWHHTAVDRVRQGDLSFPGAAGAAAEAARRFLERWLAGTREEREPAPVRYWRMGEERWCEAETWPPPPRPPLRLHLYPDGSLRERPPDLPGARSFLSDPARPVPTVGGANLPLGLRAGPCDQREIEGREDVLVYETEPLREPLAVLGSPTVTLTAATDAVDEDLAVRLTDVHEDGRSILVGDSIQRAKLRASTARPVPLVPGRWYEVTVRLPPAAVTFLPGHRIRILLAGTNWPRYERNPHTGADHHDPADAVPARTVIHHGGDARSFLSLPREEGAASGARAP